MKPICLIQGSIRRGFPEVLEAMQKTFSNVLVAAWRNEASLLPPGNYETLLCDPPPLAGLNNRNLQRTGMALGIREARRLGATHVLRWRTDLLSTSIDLENLLHRAHWDVPRGLTSRIVMSAWRNLSVHPDWFSTLPDLFMFGEIDAMERAWGMEGLDPAKPANFPPEMIHELGLVWNQNNQEFEVAGKRYGLREAYDAHVEFYAWLKARLQRDLYRKLSHPEIATNALSLIDHRSLRICWFKDEPRLTFRSIFNAPHHPWWTEAQWRKKRAPKVLGMAYPTSVPALVIRLWNASTTVLERRWQRSIYLDYLGQCNRESVRRSLQIVAVNHIGLNGGAEFALRDLIKGLVNKGRKVKLVNFEDGVWVQEARQSGAEVKVVAMPKSFVRFPMKPKFRDYFDLFGLIFTFPVAWCRLAMAISGKGVIVISNSPKSLIASRLWTKCLGLRHVHFLHDNLSQGYGPRLFASFIITLMRSCSVVMCVSAATKESLVARGFPGRKALVVRQGIRFPHDRKSHRHSSARFVIGTVSRLNNIKNLEQIVDALVLLRAEGREAELEIAGETLTEKDRHYLEELKARVEAAGLCDRVHFIGFYEDVWAALARFDVFVTTSRNEGMGRTVIEAMGYGLPVVVTPVGGLAENVKDGETGRWTVLDDPGHLAQTLAQLMDDDAESRRLGMAASSWARDTYSMECYVETASRILDSIDSGSIP